MLGSRTDSWSIVAALICGDALLLICGATWLWAGLHFSLRDAFYMGILPFLPGDVIKLIAAFVVSRRYIKRAKVLFYSL
jgi:biotin transport system substrate-specific component